MTTPPIDKQHISLTTAALIIAATFGAGGGLAYAEARISGAEQRIALVEAQGRKLDKLAMVICLDSPEREARCQRMGLVQ